jgi:molybdopterin-guanine dinucleotide biosynthesis protein A
VNSPGQTQPHDAVTGVVLAGGRSARMGADKALLPLGSDRLLQRSLTALRQCFDRVMIIANDLDAYRAFGLPVHPDEQPGLGPIGGVCAALQHAVTPAIFVVACDMPFLDPGLIRRMTARLEDFDAVVPKPAGRFEPLHALYQRRILAEVRAAIAAGELSMQHLLGRLRLNVITDRDLAGCADAARLFFNINTPADLARAGELDRR